VHRGRRDHPPSSAEGRGWRDAGWARRFRPTLDLPWRGGGDSWAAARLLLRVAGCGGGWTALLALASLASAAGETLLPAALGRAVDAVLAAGANADAAARWPAACVALAGAIVACDALGQLAGGSSTAAATAWLRNLVWRHVLAGGPAMTRRFAAGDVVSRLVGGATDAGAAPAAAVGALTSAVPAIGAPVALALIDPRLALAFAAGLPVLVLVLRAFARDTARAMARYQRAQAAIAARLLDALRGARTIAAAGTLEREAARVLAALPELGAAGSATWRMLGRVSGREALLVPLLQVVVLAAGGVELAAGRVSPGEVLAASQYAALGSGLGGLVPALNRLARARAAALRAGELLAVAPMRYGAEALPAGPGRLELHGVRVRLGGELVLDGLDLLVPQGAVVAIVGRSGAGKSVLAALAGRLLDPDEGEVRLDGVALPLLSRRELRRAVQYAFERPAPLGGTLAGAIAFGPTELTRCLVQAAARSACADEFIRRLPRGYDTPLARAPLSGGEAQRVGLARAFAHARAARLVVLDDATSSLDAATELQVARALARDLGRLTRVVVAHRAVTAAGADLVAWLDGGRVRACGPHRALWGDPDYRAAFAAGPEAAAGEATCPAAG